MICRRGTAHQLAPATYAYRDILHGKRSNNSLSRIEVCTIRFAASKNMKRVIHRHFFPFTILTFADDTCRY